MLEYQRQIPDDCAHRSRRFYEDGRPIGLILLVPSINMFKCTVLTACLHNNSDIPLEERTLLSILLESNQSTPQQIASEVLRRSELAKESSLSSRFDDEY